jgi:hypothetical protein
MAGPCFTLVYRSFGRGEWMALGTWLSVASVNQIARDADGLTFSLDASAIPRSSRAQREKSAQPTLGFTAHLRDAPFDAKAERDAIEKVLGFVPAQALSVCAVSGSPANVDGLLHIQKGVVQRFGGWFAFQRGIPPEAASLQNGITAVEVADYQAFFGEGPVDPDYLAQYEQFVPRKTIYFVDAKATGFSHVDV